jgi:hypothetical protein
MLDQIPSLPPGVGVKFSLFQDLFPGPLQSASSAVASCRNLLPHAMLEFCKPLFTPSPNLFLKTHEVCFALLPGSYCRIVGII